MKRLLTLIMTFMMAVSVCLPVHAQFSFAEDTAAESTTEKQTVSTTPAVSENSLNESSESNAIGDTSSYYDVDQLGGAPDITAESAIVMDASSGAVLYTKAADEQRYPASITKVMTALLAIENCSMDDIVTFSNEAVNGIEAGSSSAGINVGAQLTVEDTLYALMLVSANEAAAALAEHISGSIDAFADLMNTRAKELGCTGTHFTNPHGLPDENHYTTAHDMGLILKKAMEYDEFRKIAETESYTLQKSDTLSNTLELWNHAKILRENSEYYYKYAEGAKTGYTMAALNTLVTYAKKGNVELLCVILKDHGADNSYYDTSKLFSWAFKKVKTVQPLSSFNLTNALENNKSISPEKADSLRNLNCTFPTDYSILVKKDFDDSSLKTAFVYDEDTHTGKVGYINISVGDTVIGTAPVTYDINTEEAQTYLSSGEASDDLETAPVDQDRLTPSKLFSYIIKAIIVVIVLLLLIAFIQRQRAEKRRQRRIMERKKKHAASDTRVNRTSSKKTSRRNKSKK